MTFFMVADGHGGHHVSTFAAAKMLDLICDALVKREPTADALQDVISNAFLGLNSEVCSDTFDAGANAAGSTLTVCCINATRGEIHCWNVGDSLALVVHDRGYVELGVTCAAQHFQPAAPSRAVKGCERTDRPLGARACAQASAGRQPGRAGARRGHRRNPRAGDERAGPARRAHACVSGRPRRHTCDWRRRLRELCDGHPVARHADGPRGRRRHHRARAALPFDRPRRSAHAHGTTHASGRATPLGVPRHRYAPMGCGTT